MPKYRVTMFMSTVTKVVLDMEAESAESIQDMELYDVYEGGEIVAESDGYDVGDAWIDNVTLQEG